MKSVLLSLLISLCHPGLFAQNYSDEKQLCGEGMTASASEGVGYKFDAFTIDHPGFLKFSQETNEVYVISRELGWLKGPTPISYCITFLGTGIDQGEPAALFQLNHINHDNKVKGRDLASGRSVYSGNIIARDYDLNSNRIGNVELKSATFTIGIDGGARILNFQNFGQVSKVRINTRRFRETGELSIDDIVKLNGIEWKGSYMEDLEKQIQQEVRDRNYKTVIKKADEQFANGNCEYAVRNYYVAIKMKTNDSHALSKIKACKQNEEEDEKSKEANTAKIILSDNDGFWGGVEEKENEEIDKVIIPQENSTSKRMSASIDGNKIDDLFKTNALIRLVNGAEVILGIFKDDRDGNEYKTLTVLDEELLDGSYVGVEKTMMIQPLRYSSSGSGCYNDKIANCNNYGRLYTYKSAQIAVPDGWRIPKSYEFINFLAETRKSKKKPALLSFVLQGKREKLSIERLFRPSEIIDEKFLLGGVKRWDSQTRRIEFLGIEKGAEFWSSTKVYNYHERKYMEVYDYFAGYLMKHTKIYRLEETEEFWSDSLSIDYGEMGYLLLIKK